MPEPMQLNQYQHQALRTLKPGQSSQQIAYYCALLAGEEIGEILGLFAKQMRDGLPIDGLQGEIGDLLWALAVLANSQGWTLEEVARANIKKLWERYPNGFVKDWRNNGGK